MRTNPSGKDRAAQMLKDGLSFKQAFVIVHQKIDTAPTPQVRGIWQRAELWLKIWRDEARDQAAGLEIKY